MKVKRSELYKLRSQLLGLLVSRRTRLQWDLEWGERALKEELTAALNTGRGAELNNIRMTWHVEMSGTEEELEEIETGHIVSEARRLRVPLPPKWKTVNQLTDDWDEGALTGASYLTPQGYAKLRDAIRQEKKARLESRASHIVWITAASGFVGICTGLAAVMKPADPPAPPPVVHVFMPQAVPPSASAASQAPARRP